jgi:hypothetical protein
MPVKGLRRNDNAMKNKVGIKINNASNNSNSKTPATKLLFLN